MSKGVPGLCHHLKDVYTWRTCTYLLHGHRASCTYIYISPRRKDRHIVIFSEHSRLSGEHYCDTEAQVAGKATPSSSKQSLIWLLCALYLCKKDYSVFSCVWSLELSHMDTTLILSCRPRSDNGQQLIAHEAANQCSTGNADCSLRFTMAAS